MLKLSSFPVILGVVAILASGQISRAQNISATVAPNIGGSDNYVDIENTSGGDWYFFSNAVPSAASMSRISGFSEFPWPSVGNFGPDPDEEYNRIYQDEYLRVYPNTLASGTITIPFSYTPSGTRYDFLVTVLNGAQVTAMPILDPSPTTAATVSWEVSFSQAISGVTAANFAFNNPDGITGLSIASVTADTAEPATNWTVTADTGTGTGVLGLNWAGHVSETPSVPNTFEGDFYDFTFYPVIDQDLTNVAIDVNSTTTMTIVASLRGTGGTIYYQWYKGTAADLSAAVVIPGANASSYMPPSFTTPGSFQYFVVVSNAPGSYTYSSAATITVVDPPDITSPPQTVITASNLTATFTVTATGTSLNYQWYAGSLGDTSNPVGSGLASFTTDPLSENSTFWVYVYNAGPRSESNGNYNATVITQLVPLQTGYGSQVNTIIPAAFQVRALDSAGADVLGAPIVFQAVSTSGAGGTFNGGLTQTTVDTTSAGIANTSIFTANSVAGFYYMDAAFSSFVTAIPVTNYATMNSRASAAFGTGITNTFTFAQTGLTEPAFSTSGGSPPRGVTMGATGVLSGAPPIGSGGVYNFNVNAQAASQPTLTQPFTLTVIEKSNLIAYPSFYTNGVAWGLNGDDVNGGPSIVNNAFKPTDDTAGENRSAWLMYPLYVGAFQASFIYQDVYGDGADGVAFVIQNSTNGTSALGIAGGGLGYCGISNSVGVLMNIYGGSPGGAGIMLGANGIGAYNGAGVSSGRSYGPTGNVDFDNGYPILVSLLYTNQNLNVTFSDQVNTNVFETNYSVNIPAFVGANAAYVGFTGSEGGVYSSQTISNFSYVPLPAADVTTAPGNSIVLSWPASVGGFIIQTNATLNSATWFTASAAITQSNDLNQATFPLTHTPCFYRLTLPPN